MRHKRAILLLTTLLIAMLACSMFGSGGSSAGADDSPSAPGGSGKYDTEFPVPNEVENFLNLEDGSINFQTPMKLNEVLKFYRDAFAQAGYDEREITTAITDTTFSIVWDGHASGKAIVVQAVDLGDGTVNVNVRLEDI